MAFWGNKPRRAIRCVSQAEIVNFSGFSYMLTDTRTNGHTYRDARTHLKTLKRFQNKEMFCMAQNSVGAIKPHIYLCPSNSDVIRYAPAIIVSDFDYS